MPAVPEWGQEYNHKFVAISADIDDVYRYNEMDELRKVRYDQLAERYGDIGYDRPNFRPILCAAENISVIELICLEDVDAMHPAGSSVADLFGFEGETQIEYIQSRYSSAHKKVINKKLTEVGSADLVLLGEVYYDPYLFSLFPIEQQACPAWGKKLRLTLNYENQHPISKEFTLEKGEY